MSTFCIDPRLEADSKPVCALSQCDVRLMNDRRWPWIILVPRIEGAVELHELEYSVRQAVENETAIIAGVIKQITNAEKINIAAIGNIVRQLHIHVIARKTGDPNWPGPVWGFGKREIYSPAELEQFTVNVKSALCEAGFSHED